jgi:hypothetical protein
MKKKWIYCRIREQLIPEEEYQRPEKPRAVVPDWVSPTPIRGHWKLRKQEDGSYQLEEYGEQQGVWDNLFAVDDTIDPIEHPVSGKVFTSRSQLEAEHKRLGFETTSERISGRQKGLVRDAKQAKQQIIEVIQKWKTPSWAEQERQRQAYMREHPERSALKLDEMMGYTDKTRLH